MIRDKCVDLEFVITVACPNQEAYPILARMEHFQTIIYDLLNEQFENVRELPDPWLRNDPKCIEHLQVLYNLF